MERHFRQKLRLHVERSRFSWWRVEIFMMNGRGFHDKPSRFWWWTVEDFMRNGRDFHDERLRFSWWTVEIFMMTGPELLYCFGLNPVARAEHLAIQLLRFEDSLFVLSSFSLILHLLYLLDYLGRIVVWLHLIFFFQILYGYLAILLINIVF